jgi:hypothetical protein
MTDAVNVWIAQIEAYFAARPERDYLLRQMPLDALDAVMAAGWVVGSASTAPGDPPGLTIDRGQRNVPCIVRRADPAEGRPLPGVLFLDAAGPMPPLPRAADPARGEETLAAGLWQLSKVAAALDVSLFTFLSRSLNRAPG